nr:MAG: RNA-dependent RNA polymerase [Riboviria sp.]
MRELGPEMDDYVWPDCSYAAMDKSLCYHSRRFLESKNQVDDAMFDKIPYVVNTVERVYARTKVVWDGFPRDWDKFIREGVDWNSSPGWPWKRQYPTNRDLFGFDGVNLLPERVEMVRAAVEARWSKLRDEPYADPIHLFIKQEPHKRSKAKKEAWRLISGVGLTDTLVDRILYGAWLDKLIEDWPFIPSKAGWAPSANGFKFLTRKYRNREPVSIDKSSWDWTVGEWHIRVLTELVPRMVFRGGEDWDKVFHNRMKATYHAGYPRFKPGCECEFTQLVTGIQKSGSLNTIGFNSICQFADHIAAGGDENDAFDSLGDDTAQEMVADLEHYLDQLRKTGAIVKEIDRGWPIKFGGHEMTEEKSIPCYRGKHMFALLHLDDRFGPETLDSYRHLYALDPEMSDFLERLTLKMYGPKNVLSQQHLRDWYLAIDQL